MTTEESGNPGEAAIENVIAGGVLWREHDHTPRPCCIGAILAALTAADIACVYAPKGVAVPHGARLVDRGYRGQGLFGPRVYAVEPSYVTKTGKVLTDEDLEKLADEAERGYDVSHLKDRGDRLLARDWGDAWDSLPEAPDLVPKPCPHGEVGQCMACEVSDDQEASHDS